MEKLKECPFCGGSAVFKTIENLASHHSVAFRFETECGDCGAKLPQTYKVEFNLNCEGDITPLRDERERAIEEWNKRVAHCR